jgi:hypothetical protein
MKRVKRMGRRWLWPRTWMWFRFCLCEVYAQWKVGKTLSQDVQ